MSHEWVNWSGSVRCQPHTVLVPQDEAEVQRLLHQLGNSATTVRVVGSGHSFVPLCASDEIQLSLDQLQGLIATSPLAEGGLATLWAGTKLHQSGEPLWHSGLSLANMGDIDRQALAGAVSTGTHGTGRQLGSIATQVVGLRMVLASGEVVECSAAQNPDIFKAAQVSLGLLGILTQMTLKCLPAYHLHERTWVASFEECTSQLEQQIASNRHFEFFWSPGEDACAMKALNPVELTPAEAQNLPIVRSIGEEAKGRLARYVKDERIDRNYCIFPSERNLKFNEMEFAVLYANGPDCLREIRHLMQSKHRNVLWPIEYRTLAADDLWLSPAYGRETVTISIHQAADQEQRSFFADAEAIFRNHHGRPHWGKMHSFQANDLSLLYPQWAHFVAIRQQLDPNGRFLNPYLRTIFV